MAITDAKISFTRRYWAVAVAAGKRFGLNPVVLLAQAAQESSWGLSYSAGFRRNFFGILAVGSPNPWWGGQGTASKANPHLVFRVYNSDSDSFHDYARLVSRKYPQVAKLSADIDAYAAAMAASDYIFEGNGDDRDVYRHNVAQFGHEIAAIVANATGQKHSWVMVAVALILAVLTFGGSGCARKLAQPSTTITDSTTVTETVRYVPFEVPGDTVRQVIQLECDKATGKVKPVVAQADGVGGKAHTTVKVDENGQLTTETICDKLSDSLKVLDREINRLRTEKRVVVQTVYLTRWYDMAARWAVGFLLLLLPAGWWLGRITSKS